MPVKQVGRFLDSAAVNELTCYGAGTIDGKTVQVFRMSGRSQKKSILYYLEQKSSGNAEVLNRSTENYRGVFNIL
jgi:hypothetical protein